MGFLAAEYCCGLFPLLHKHSEDSFWLEMVFLRRKYQAAFFFLFELVLICWNREPASLTALLLMCVSLKLNCSNSSCTKCAQVVLLQTSAALRATELFFKLLL